MPRLSKLVHVLAAMVVLWGLAPALARAADPCRRAVVIYLDVSGSMYEQKYMSESPWSGGRQITLMENTVRFLENSLLAPGSLAVRPGDHLILRGFYGKVAPLGPALSAFNPEQDAARLGKDMDKRLDFNQNQKYDLGDAKPELHKFRFNNIFLEDQKVLATDFAGVLQDMMQIYRSTPLEPGTEQAFDKLIFIVLTDGGHENDKTQDLYKTRVQEAAALMKEKIAQGRVQVHLFGVVAATRGAFREMEKRQDVTPDFLEHLGARFTQLDMSYVKQEWFNAYLVGLAERIEMDEVGPARYQYPPLPAPGSPPPAAPAVGKIVVPLKLTNRACRPLELSEVQCLLLKLPDPGEGSPAAKEAKSTQDKRSYAMSKIVEGRYGKSNLLNEDLSYDLPLKPGRYQLELTAVSKGLGQAPKKVVDLTVGEPPQPPEEPVNILRILLVLVLLGGGAVFMVHHLRKPGGKGPGKA
ncbi:MAG: hypothetical protein HY794_09995 [Desulfarculus sp.]|nr:hypothetical protein [Desulfarculus sp.]